MKDSVAPAEASPHRWAHHHMMPLANVVDHLFEEEVGKAVSDHVNDVLRETPPKALLLHLAARLARGARSEDELQAVACHHVRPWFESGSNRERLRRGAMGRADQPPSSGPGRILVEHGCRRC